MDQLACMQQRVNSNQLERYEFKIASSARLLSDRALRLQNGRNRAARALAAMATTAATATAPPRPSVQHRIASLERRLSFSLREQWGHVNEAVRVAEGRASKGQSTPAWERSGRWKSSRSKKAREAEREKARPQRKEEAATKRAQRSRSSGGADDVRCRQWSEQSRAVEAERVVDSMRQAQSSSTDSSRSAEQVDRTPLCPSDDITDTALSSDSNFFVRQHSHRTNPHLTNTVVLP